MFKFIRGKGKEKDKVKKLRTRVYEADVLEETVPAASTTKDVPKVEKRRKLAMIVNIEYSSKTWALHKTCDELFHLRDDLKSFGSASGVSVPHFPLIPLVDDVGSSTEKRKRRGGLFKSKSKKRSAASHSAAAPADSTQMHEEQMTADSMARLRDSQAYTAVESPFLRELTMSVDCWLDSLTNVAELHDTSQVSQFLDWSRHKTIVPAKMPYAVHRDTAESVFDTLDSGLSSAGFADFASASGEKISMKDFDLLKVLGKGSFGKVILVRRKRNASSPPVMPRHGLDADPVFAMKILKKQRVFQRFQVEHTKTERRVLGLLASLQHPFFVSLHAAFQDEDKLFMVLDYCPGGEMFFHLSKARRFDENRTRFYSAEIVLALEFLHERDIIYRDLKPENVLLSATGHVKLTDFGLCKENIPDHVSATSFCGTPEYLAPEIVKKIGHGKAADWWTLGALLFEMLSGVPPFYSRNRDALFDKILHTKMKFPPHFGKDACDLIKRLMTRNYKHRIGTRRGSEEVKEHRFFSGVDFAALLRLEIEPPFKPALKRDKHGVIGGANFDPEFVSMPIHSVDEKAKKGGRKKSVKKKTYPPFEKFTFDILAMGEIEDKAVDGDDVKASG